MSEKTTESLFVLPPSVLHLGLSRRQEWRPGRGACGFVHFAAAHMKARCSRHPVAGSPGRPARMCTPLFPLPASHSPPTHLGPLPQLHLPRGGRTGKPPHVRLCQEVTSAKTVQNEDLLKFTTP